MTDGSNWQGWETGTDDLSSIALTIEQVETTHESEAEQPSLFGLWAADRHLVPHPPTGRELCVVRTKNMRKRPGSGHWRFNDDRHFTEP